MPPVAVATAPDLVGESGVRCEAHPLSAGFDNALPVDDTGGVQSVLAGEIALADGECAPRSNA